MTNGDRIRSMTDDELAYNLNKIFYSASCSDCPCKEKCKGRVHLGFGHCVNMFLKWVKEEVKENVN